MKSSQRDPKILLRYYTSGSLAVLLLCLAAVAFALSWIFTAKENRRAQISLNQVGHFMDFQYRQISQEMWTSSYEAIDLRVKDIASQIGNAKYELFLVSEDGICQFASGSLKPSSSRCKIPDHLKGVIPALKTTKESNPILGIDAETGMYRYMAPLFVGTVLKGFILCRFSDPYDFFRGGSLTVAAKYFFPTVIIVICVWFFWLYISRRLILRPYMEAIIDLQKQEALGALASQVAHDIRSPLSALSMVVPTLDVPEEKRLLLRNAVQRINDIANGLFQKGKLGLGSRDPGTSMLGRKETVMLVSVIDSIISEKRLEHRRRMEVSICADLTAGYGIFVYLDPAELGRALSNLINNAVEAITNAGQIDVRINVHDDTVTISVIDNGRGIADEVLKKLGAKGISFGKASSETSGNGLGVYHAMNFAAEAGGRLDINSVLGQGSKVSITLPRVSPPPWFIAAIKLRFGSTVISVDDDQTIHQVWKERLAMISGSEAAVIHLTFSSLNELEQWILSKDRHGDLFLVDYELLGESANGLDAIGKLGIKNSSILVTSRFEEPTVIRRAAELGVSVIPKSMAAYVPIEIKHNCEQYNAILVDDDSLVHAVWQHYAKGQSLTIKSFMSAYDFLKAVPELDKDTNLFIDVSLGNGIRGEDVSRQAWSLGFSNIYLATGYEPGAIVKPECVKKIVGKEPCF